jgi:3',5'-cyclic AMP phosphodiesterase CpdA
MNFKLVSGTLMILISCFLFLRCTEKNLPLFRHDIASGKTPWSAEPAGKPAEQFTFAIIGDLNSGERAGVLEVAIQQLNLLRPEFILSIGDLVEGGTVDTLQLKKEYEHFDERVGKAKAPFFHIGGNHDLTNPVMRKYWESRYGKRYYHFVYQNVLFLMLDSEDYAEPRMWEIFNARARAIELLDSGQEELAKQGDYYKMPERVTGEISDDQSAYFEKVIAENPTVRWTFVLMHKPVWQREGNGNLSRIEAALGARNYTVLNGHLHKYSYTERNNRDYIMVATTGGGQDPKSDMAFDHVMMVTLTEEGPAIANLRLDGILNKQAKIPLDSGQFCFQASRCTNHLEH